MATNSEVPYCSKCSKSYKLLLENYQKERDNFQRARTEILGYQMSLESLEVMLKTHEKNEYAWGDKYEQMEYDLKIRDLKLEEKQKELDQALKERDDFKIGLIVMMKTDVSDKSKETAFNSGEEVPSPKEILIPPAYLQGWVEYDLESTCSTSRSTDDSYYPRMKVARPRIQVTSPSSRSSTNKTPHRPQRPRKLLNRSGKEEEVLFGSQAVLPQTNKDKLSDFKEFKGGYVAFGMTLKVGRISAKRTIKTSMLNFEK
ncbi:hypothetical protein Tco_0750917 [Tanacetum coccineum]|uniref:Uncharacterized protein n=1 Tax=Tanacetum coccineum TaxID=301880 RepID=A0ABQ4Z564_9ASTR